MDLPAVCRSIQPMQSRMSSTQAIGSGATIQDLDGVTFDTGADARMHGLGGGYDLHLAAEQVGQVEFQPGKIEQREPPDLPTVVDLCDQVDVARRHRFAARDRAEQPE